MKTVDIGYCDKSLIVTVLGYIEKFENDQAESDDWVVTKVMNKQQVQWFMHYHTYHNGLISLSMRHNSIVHDARTFNNPMMQTVFAK